MEFNGINYKQIGSGKGAIVVWGHGWGQDHRAFESLVAPFKDKATHILIDFPGFGDSKKPDSAWGSEDYADAVSALIQKVSDGPVIWIGHSFGCRVGLQLAARYPKLIGGLFLIAGAGIPRQLPVYKSLYFKARITVFKLLKQLIPLGLDEDWLRSKFGSADYKNADPVMRNILVKVVNEDLRGIAADITCPTTLIYGDKDTETPPQIGQMLHALIENSKLVVLSGQDHYTLLLGGHHQVLRHLKDFLNNNKTT